MSNPASFRPRKAVLPAAGFGTRFLPIAKAIPKEMLPIGDKPVIHHVVAEAVAAGYTDILIVVSRDKNSIVDYFDRSPELERRLRDKGRDDLADSLVAIASQARFHFVRQAEMKGLGDAVLQAREHVGDEPFALLLADTLFVNRQEHLGAADALDALGHAYREFGSSAVAIEPVAMERISRYGVVGGFERAPGMFALETLVEKPEAADAPQLRRLNGQIDPNGWAFAARYLFTPALFKYLANTRPGKNGEIQLTDAMQALLREEGFNGCQLPGERLDIGNPEGLLKANLRFAKDFTC